MCLVAARYLILWRSGGHKNVWSKWFLFRNDSICLVKKLLYRYTGLLDTGETHLHEGGNTNWNIQIQGGEEVMYCHFMYLIWIYYLVLALAIKGSSSIWGGLVERSPRTDHAQGVGQAWGRVCPKLIFYHFSIIFFYKKKKLGLFFCFLRPVFGGWSLDQP